MTKIVHCKKESYDVYIGRPSIWGNPFPIRLSALHGFAEYEGSREWSLNEYRKYIRNRPDLIARLGELDGKVLGCWCAPRPCHGDILIELINELSPHS